MKLIKNIFVLALSCLLHTSATTVNKIIRVGLDTQALECVIALDGGGEIQDLEGRSLLCLKHGERLRIWLNNNGDAIPINEFRVQVGPPVSLKRADVIIRKLQAVSAENQPEKLEVPDGGTWRVVLGHYKDSKDAMPMLTKLKELGFQELWVATEPLTKNIISSSYELYAINEHYERHLLPNRGIKVISTQNLITLPGKGRYRGFIEISPNTNCKLSVINVVDMESYLRGVVPMEMSSGNFPELEALKAQAVAARTYAFANIGKRAKYGFDLVDTISDQVYGGRDKEQELTDKAVMETSGLIATYNGLPIQALFMANAGGATVDNSFVFGGACNYLKGTSNYTHEPMAIVFNSESGDRDGHWITWEILRLTGKGLLSISQLKDKYMKQQAQASELFPILKNLALRLGQPIPKVTNKRGTNLYLWMGQSLGFQAVAEGIEHHQDASYFLGKNVPDAHEKLLASFLTRKGIVSPTAWRNHTPTMAQALQALGRLWYELEPIEFSEGTLLRNGEVRRKGYTSNMMIAKTVPLLAEEAPGGSLRLVNESNIQVGDKIKWLSTPAEACSILIRRLDPNGAAMNRYSPASHWKAELKEKDFLETLRIKVNIQSLKDINLTHNNQGRVVKMDIIDDLGQNYQFTGMRIRNLLGLRDNIFRIITIGNKPNRRWVIYGRGWGHGVGMDQTGAYGMALEGCGFKKILQHYYDGIQFTCIGS
jgi:stage II sporulation protein D